MVVYKRTTALSHTHTATWSTRHTTAATVQRLKYCICRSVRERTSRKIDGRWRSGHAVRDIIEKHLPKWKKTSRRQFDNRTRPVNRMKFHFYLFPEPTPEKSNSILDRDEHFVVVFFQWTNWSALLLWMHDCYFDLRQILYKKMNKMVEFNRSEHEWIWISFDYNASARTIFCYHEQIDTYLLVSWSITIYKMIV